MVLGFVFVLDLLIFVHHYYLKCPTVIGLLHLSDPDFITVISLKQMAFNFVDHDSLSRIFLKFAFFCISDMFGIEALEYGKEHFLL